MKLVFDQYTDVPTLQMEEVEQLQADDLNIHTEWKLRNAILAIGDQINSAALQGSQEEIIQGLLERAEMQGRMQAYKDLLADSKEAKAKRNTL